MFLGCVASDADGVTLIQRHVGTHPYLLASRLFAAAFQERCLRAWLPAKLKGLVVLRWLGNLVLCASVGVAAAAIWAYGEHANAVVYIVAGAIVLIGPLARFFLADSSSDN
jgi:hypothetical protein